MLFVAAVILSSLPGAAAADSAGATGYDLGSTNRLAFDGRYIFGFEGYRSESDDPSPRDFFRYDPARNVVDRIRGRFPYNMTEPTPASDGQDIWLFGGTVCQENYWGDTDCATVRKVYRYRPADGSLVDTHLELPFDGTPDATATIDGNIYLFWGSSVYRFRPDWTQFTRVPVSVPFGSERAVVATGGRIVIITSSTTDARIDLLDPRSATLTAGPALPNGRWFGAMEAGGTVFAFARPWSGTQAQPVVAYDPVAGSVTPLAATIPGQPTWAVAVDIGTEARIFASDRNRRFTLRFDAATRSVTDLSARLPSTPYRGAPVWTGTEAIVFGGFSNDHQSHVDMIVRFRPSTSATVTSTARLPSARYRAAAFYDGRHAYVFGGAAACGYPCEALLLDDIIRYDPATDVATTLPARLPAPLAGAAAGFDGRHGYLFGGQGPDNGSEEARIRRFDPATGALEVMRASFTFGMTDAAVAYDGRYFFLFGSGDGGVVRYDPQADEVKYMLARFPGDTWIVRTGLTAAYDGRRYIYLIGGRTTEPCTEYECDDPWELLRYVYYDEVWRYDPQTDTLAQMDARFDMYPYQSTAVWTGSEMLAFKSATTFRYAPQPSPPALTAAAEGPELGTVSLQWEPPPASSYSQPLLGYRVYRDDALIADVSAAATSYVDRTATHGVTGAYRVSAYNADGEGLRSGSLRATPLASSEPLGLEAVSGPGVNQITLRWQAPAQTLRPITGYRIYRGTQLYREDPYTDVGDVRTFTDSSAGAGAAFSYRVAAITSAGPGRLSAPSFATGAGRADPPHSLIAVPGPGLGQVTLRWQPPGSTGGLPLLGYRVRRSVERGAATVIGETAQTQFVDRDCPLLDECEYTVSAVTSAGESVPSPAARATGWYYSGMPSVTPTPPSAPTDAYVVDSRDNVGVATATLAAGVRYRLTARGSFHYSAPWGAYLADAECATANGANWSAALYGDSLLDLLVDGAPQTWQPAGSPSGPGCSRDNTYTLEVTGAGAPLRLKIDDDGRGDNAGALTVSIQAL